MKKILSLLSMLMITVMAFATDYTDQLTFKLTVGSNSSEKSLPQGTLTIEKRVDGTYNVTASGCDFSAAYFGNWGDISCDGVAGTTNADGLTTIEVSKPEVFANGSVPSGYSLSGQSLLVKFNGTKAYALLKGKLALNAIVGYPFEYTFGTDKGFDGGSIGGGETGGETSSVVTVLENFKNDGNRFNHSFKIDWDKQKVVMSIDPTSCGNDLEHIVGLGVDCTQWDEALHVYNKYFDRYGTPAQTYNRQMLQAYFPMPGNNNNTGVFDRKSPFSIEVSKDKGFVVDGEVKISASQMTSLFAQANLTVGSGQGDDAASHALYKYIKVVPLNWTEVPPVTVLITKKFNDVDYSNTWSQAGTANVTFEEMSDETVKMKFATDGINISANALTKGTDAKNRTTYTGDAVNDAMPTLTYTIKAVVYTEGTEEKLYMTMEANSGVTFNVGEDPDYVAPVTYKNTLYVVENAKLLVETPDAEVVLQDKGDNKYDVTLPAFTADGKDVPSITFEATKADNKLTASNVTVNNVYNGEAAVVTMDGTFEADNKLFASLTVKCGELFDYEVGYGIKPFVATTKEYTAEWANVKVGDAEPVNFQNAKVDYTEFAKGQYSLTFKDLTIGGKKVGDFTIKYVSKDNMGQFSTTATTGEWTRVEADQDVASLGDMPSISGFEGVIGGTGDGTLFVKFTINAYGTVAVDFGHKYEAPEPPVVPEVVDVVEEGFKATGSSWKKEGIAIDWDTQYIAAKLDLSTCKVSARPENVLAVGTDITGWNDGPHYFFYYNKADKVLQYNYLHKANSSYNSGFANLSKAYIQLTDEVVTIEISKQGGLKINGESALVKYVNTASNPSNNSTESWTTEDLPTVFSGLWALNPIDFGGCQGDFMSNATYKYVKVVPLGWKEPVTPPSVKDTKTFNEALYMVQGTTSSKLADATVEVKEMSDKTINMSLKYMETEYTSTELTKGTDDKNRTTYTGKVSNGSQTYDVAGVVYEKDNAERLYMTMTAAGVTLVVGENPDAVTPDPGVTEESNKTYTSNLRILDGETTVVEEAEANVNIIKYSDESYKVTLKNVNMLNKTQDLVFVGKALIEEAPTEATEPLTIIAKSDEATTAFFGEEMNGTFEITEVSAEEIKMGFVLNNTSLEYQGEFNYTEEETPEVYTSNLHIYDAAAPETDLFQADQAKVEFLATATGGFKLTLKDVTLNEKTQDLVFTGTLPTPQPGGQDPLAEEGETTPAEPAMVLNATADEATATFLGATSATAVFNVSYDKNDNFMMTFTITAGDKNYAGEFNYEKKTPDTPDPELFCKENYVADGEGFEWKIAVDWETQKIVMSIDPSTCTGSCEHVIGLGASPTTFHGNLHLYRTNDQQLQGYFETAAGNNNTGKFAETAPFLVEVSKAQGFVVNNEVKIASSAMSDLFTLSTVKMGTGEGVNDKSRATYNYVKVVDKDWTAPKDPDTGINATTVAEGEVEFFTVNGVKLNKLQKGLNIVRTADGKVKKVLVK